MAERKSSYQSRQNLQLNIPMPDFLKKMAGVAKPQEEIDEERSARAAALRERGEQEDEAPQVVVLKSGDLTKEEADSLTKQGYKDTSSLQVAYGSRGLKQKTFGKMAKSTPDVVFQPPTTKAVVADKSSVNGKAPAEAPKRKAADSADGPAPKKPQLNKTMLSFADDI